MTFPTAPCSLPHPPCSVFRSTEFLCCNFSNDETFILWQEWVCGEWHDSNEAGKGIWSSSGSVQKLQRLLAVRASVLSCFHSQSLSWSVAQNCLVFIDLSLGWLWTPLYASFTASNVLLTFLSAVISFPFFFVHLFLLKSKTDIFYRVSFQNRPEINVILK